MELVDEITFQNIELRYLKEDDLHRYINFSIPGSVRFDFNLDVYKAAFIFIRNAVNMISYEIKSLEVELDNIKIRIELDDSSMLYFEKQNGTKVGVEVSYAQLIKIVNFISHCQVSI